MIKKANTSLGWQMIICLGALLLLTFPGCAGTKEQVGSHELSKILIFPQGWRRVDTDSFFMMTRRSADKEYMLVHKRPLEKPFMFSKSILNADMVSTQACDVFISELSADPNLYDMQVVNRSPVTINSYKGFKLEFEYGLKGKGRFETVCYGFIIDDQFYSVRYNTSSANGDKISSSDLERIVMTFRLAVDHS